MTAHWLTNDDKWRHFKQKSEIILKQKTTKNISSRFRHGVAMVSSRCRHHVVTVSSQCRHCVVTITLKTYRVAISTKTWVAVRYIHWSVTFLTGFYVIKRGNIFYPYSAKVLIFFILIINQVKYSKTPSAKSNSQNLLKKLKKKYPMIINVKRYNWKREWITCMQNFR